MKRIVSLLLGCVMLITLSTGIVVESFANEAKISAEVQGTYYQSAEAQDITIRLSISDLPSSYCGFIIESVSVPEKFTIKSFSTSNASQPITAGDYNTSSGALTYASADTENSIPENTYYDLVITAPANALDDYVVNIAGVKVTHNYGTATLAEAANLSVSFSITEAPDSYAATLESANVGAIGVGDMLYVNVGSNMAFNSAEMTITYDASLVTFEEAESTLGEATVTDQNGTITLKDYGEEKSRDDKYKLAFSANSDGEAVFAITSAGFGTAVSAEKGDVEVAETPDDVKITINPASFKVTLSDIYSGNSGVNENSDYFFKPSTADGAYYNYDELPTATMGGTSVAVEVDGEHGGWVIRNVTGDLVITGNRTAKNYTVEWEGTGAADVTNKPTQATYGVPFVIELPQNTAPGLGVGYSYSLTVTIGGQEYKFSTAEYTIPGNAITGEILINVSKNEVAPDRFSVSVNGGDGNVTTSLGEVEKGDSVTLTLAPEAGYKYIATYTMGGGAAQPITWENGSATISSINGTVEINVDKVVDKTAFTLTVNEYLTLDGKMMHLIRVSGVELAQNKVYTTDGVNMFYSEAYEAYAYLVIVDSGATITEEYKATILEGINIGQGPATVVSHSYDVNMSGKTDVNDAQLVWNMYKPMYAGFTSDVTIEKYLLADVNADGVINMTDASNIVTQPNQTEATE